MSHFLADVESTQLEDSYHGKLRSMELFCHSVPEVFSEVLAFATFQLSSSNLRSKSGKLPILVHQVCVFIFGSSFEIFKSVPPHGLSMYQKNLVPQLPLVIYTFVHNE